MQIFYFLAVLCTCCLMFPLMSTEEVEVWKLNTSNRGKLKEFREIFANYGINLQVTNHDLREIDADPVTVVVHKASQLANHVLVDDTSLNIEGEEVGVNVRWLMEHLDECVGKRACWCVLLAYRENEMVYVYQGEVLGKIVNPTGDNGFGFDPYFLPDGSKQTIAEFKPLNLNARALAVDALVNDVTLSIESAITNWEGPWQGN